MFECEPDSARAVIQEIEQNVERSPQPEFLIWLGCVQNRWLSFSISRGGVFQYSSFAKLNSLWLLTKYNKREDASITTYEH